MRLALLLILLTLAACGGNNTLQPPPDAAQDVLGLEVAVDAPAPADAPLDAPGPETSSPDAAAADAVVEAGPDVPPADAPTDGVAVGDGAVDAPQADAASDTTADSDPLDHHAATVAVTVRAPGYDWTAAHVQGCTITGGMVTINAEYDRPERASFGVSGPAAGPVVLTYVDLGGEGASDVRATIRRGADYSDGAGGQRANLNARGSVRFSGGATIALDLTALGCLVR